MACRGDLCRYREEQDELYEEMRKKERETKVDPTDEWTRVPFNGVRPVFDEKNPGRVTAHPRTERLNDDPTEE